MKFIKQVVDQSDSFYEEDKFQQIEDRANDLNAVYIEYQPDIALKKILSINELNDDSKIAYIKHLAELLDIIGEEGINQLSVIIKNILKENEQIKKELLAQIDPLIELLKSKSSQAYNIIIEALIPGLSDLLSSPNLEFKESAGNQMAKIAHMLNEEDRGKHILTVVLNMAHDDYVIENRIVAVQLLSKMADCFGKDLCEQFVGLEFLSLGEDPQLQVRKEAVSNLPAIGKVVSREFFKQKLLPFYKNLSNDKTWVVRKACVEVIVEISKISDQETRENVITDMILKYLQDSNKWVKSSSYQYLGQFISTLEKMKINDKLVTHYLKMNDPSINNLFNNNEIIMACAFNFPAVLQAVGKEKWNQFHKLFQDLMANQDERVRRPLAYSLHEIGRIIGPKNSEQDLLKILNNILLDTNKKNDDVKYGAIKNLYQFLKIFDQEKRENLVDYILLLQRDSNKWRIREMVAAQFGELSSIYNSETVFKIIVPISFKLCNDPVWCVRKKACNQIYMVLKSMFQSEDQIILIYRQGVIEMIQGYSNSKKFTQRQSFVMICKNLMNLKEIFLTHFFSLLKDLAQDKIPNVRIQVAKIAYKHYQKQGELVGTDQFNELINILSKDSAREIKKYIQLLYDLGYDNNQQQNYENEFLSDQQKDGHQNLDGASNNINDQQMEIEDQKISNLSIDNILEEVTQYQDNQLQNSEDQPNEDFLKKQQNEEKQQDLQQSENSIEQEKQNQQELQESVDEDQKENELHNESQQEQQQENQISKQDGDLNQNHENVDQEKTE